jgi:hypothetical protein
MDLASFKVAFSEFDAMIDLKFMRKFLVTAVGATAALAMWPNTADATLTSVVGNTKGGNTVIASASAAAIQIQIDAASGGAILEALAPNQSGTAVVRAPDGSPVGSYFNSRTLGESAGSGKRGLGVWVQGSYTAVDNDEVGAQFDGSAFTIVAGIDYKPKKMNGKGVVGLAVVWEDVDVDTDFNVGTFEGSGVSFAPYVGFRVHKNFILDASVGYSILDYDVARTLGGTVTSDFDAQRIFGSVNLSGNFKKKKFRIAPKIGLMGLWEEQDGFTDSIGTTFGKNTIHLGRLHAGGEVGFTVKAIEPFVGARLNWDFDRNAPVDLTGAGGFAQDDSLGATFSAGINLKKKNISGQIKGETNQFKNEVTSYSVRGTIRVDF